MQQLCGTTWEKILKEVQHTLSYQELTAFLMNEYEKETIYPAQEEIWTAFDLTPYEKVKVVILGQDPYHGVNQSHGLSFSVKPGVSIPPSLRNIYKELETDLGIQPATHGYLKSWAEQGVFLLNTVLTVRKGRPHSHKGRGWEQVTDEVIKRLNERSEPMIFFLWGKASQEKRKWIDETKHVVIASSHPSPFSAHRGFFGSRPFSTANTLLQEWGHAPIDWALPERDAPNFLKKLSIEKG